MLSKSPTSKGLSRKTFLLGGGAMALWWPVAEALSAIRSDYGVRGEWFRFVIIGWAAMPWLILLPLEVLRSRRQSHATNRGRIEAPLIIMRDEKRVSPR